MIKHSKIYYVGGLFSLVFIPILFLISVIEPRKTAIHYSSIEVVSADKDVEFYSSYKRELPYVFDGKNDIIKLSNFEKFCQSKQYKCISVWQTVLPDNCNYDFFVRVIGILQRNKFLSGIDHNTIKFIYEPEINYHQEYESATYIEELNYAYSKIKEYLFGSPAHAPRIIKYSDLMLSSDYLGSFVFVDAGKIIKEEPKSSFYFRVLGFWFIPIIFVWILLFILSLNRNRKLLPNQALKLTE